MSDMSRDLPTCAHPVREARTGFTGVALRRLARVKIQTVVTVADSVATVVCAIQGATVAARYGLDLFGVLLISVVVSIGGGVIRDLLLGVRPAAIGNWCNPAIAMVTGLLIFVFHPQVGHFVAMAVTTLDAAGLALFAIVGVHKASRHGAGPLMAATLGTVTAVGGGVIRDLLLARVPVILGADIYALAAFFAGLVFIAGRRCGLPPASASIVGGAACFALRMAAVVGGWQLPKIPLV
jgi:uncharacterized membrane protein YeiH